jgi:uncharacterized membrane protein YfcA
MPQHLASLFIELTWATAGQVIFLGFIGGILSGFIGSGGAFFMTPGMMNLGVPGPIAVASNVTHKFGKALIGSKKHRELGNVDNKLTFFMLLTSIVGMQIAVWIMKVLFSKGEHAGSGSGAAADLYISTVFVVFLFLISCSMLLDIIKSQKKEDTGPSTKIVSFLKRFSIPPLIHFEAADVNVSLWIVLLSGLATGYMAGTIGVGGFVGVPAMIYIFGVPATVAAGTELYLAVFNGAWGALNYTYQGLVDIRLVLLLYAGSLIGIYIGAYGTKVVREIFIRLVTAIIIFLCVVSRAITLPIYLRQLGYLNMNPAYDNVINLASTIMLYGSGLGGGGMILFFVFRAYIRRRRVEASLSSTRPMTEVSRQGIADA